VSVRGVRRLPLEELQPYLLETPSTPGLLAWPEVFGNAHPVEVEVGCGKGLFLLGASQACPHVNFLGIEIVRKYQLFTATRMAKRGLRNVRMACADARSFLTQFVGPGSVQAVHVYFPDPWWKKRHLKRRVFQPDFAAQCERILAPGGRLFVVTDVAEYFQIMQETVRLHTQLVLEPPPDQEAVREGEYLTNFERKFRLEGRPIHRAVYKKVPPQGLAPGDRQ